MSIGKTIQIYIPNGNPRSLKIADITSRTIQAMFIPRSELDLASKRSEIKNVGIYFLIGKSDEEDKASLYIGEAEDCLGRIRQQNREKDYWSSAITITSKTQHFTKTHAKYLEWHSFNEAKKAGRYKLENTNIPTKAYVSESMEADLKDNFETIKTLVSTLGFPLFDLIRKPKHKDVLICKGKDAFAEGEYAEDGLIVFAGSKCNIKETKSAGSWVKNIRKRLQESKIIILDGDVFLFNEDHIFPSPSAAAAAVLGRRANGWTEWKYKNGKTLDEVIRQKESK